MISLRKPASEEASRAMRTKALAPALAVLLALATLAGCSPTGTLRPPSGFAELDGKRPFDYRATSADGVVLAVRAEPNEPRGSTEFWASALDLRLRRAGYASVASRAVTTSAGVAGRQMRYAREEEGRTYAYWVTVFTTKDRVYLVEAAGDREAFGPSEKAIEGAVLSFRTE